MIRTDFHKRLSRLEDGIHNLRVAPTFPIYDPNTLPQDFIEGQVVIGTNNALYWYSNGALHHQSPSAPVLGSMPQDAIEGQIVIGSNHNLCWYSSGAWHGGPGFAVIGNPPQDAVTGQLAIGNGDILCWHQDGTWYSFGAAVYELQYICGGNTAGPIGTAVVSGAPVTVTLDKPTTCDGLIYILGGWYSAHPATTAVNNVTDNLGNSWIRSGFGSAILGLASVAWSVPPPYYEAFIETFSTYRACYAGEYSAGDTITVTLANITEVSEVILMVFNFTNVTGSGVQNNAFNNFFYSDGIDYDLAGPLFPTLSYIDLYNEFVNPAADALCLSAAISYPPISSYSPLNGDFIGNVEGSSISLGASAKQLQRNETTDPGMILTGATYGVANYQLLETS